jgi:D-psicose/D-tagatose/L-ribulose 3-epimerase
MIEIPLLDPLAFDVVSAKKVLAGSGLQVAASLGLPKGCDISSEDPDAVRAGEAVLNRALEVLHDIESGYLVGVLYGMLKKYPGPATDTGRKNSQDVLGRVASRARELGVTIALEVVNRYENNLFNTCQGALAYLDELGDDSVKVHLDTYHMNIEESDLFLPVIQAGNRLGYVHIGESHRGYLGSGTVDFDAFFRALHQIGYGGPITFESFSTAVVDETLSVNLAVWRNLWNDSDDLGSHANVFIRNKLRAVESIDLQ